MGWSEKEFWESNPRKFYAFYYQYAISQRWFKTKQQVQEEKEQEEAKVLKGSDAINALTGFVGRC